ncbi:hypothetical protein EUTSA_v10027590mg [Eutrema salsugineum]|uniref:Uncharacterized protein n=1 Tax=Eutrema salsugineum TaxID=72664 RepID=V4P1D3_EUTSA|nr:hypothetical protein EUTSA_v10027590mg [Eutrema salsugineum]
MVSVALQPMNLSSSRLRWTTMAVPRPSRSPDPTALPSKVPAVVLLADAEALVAEEVEAADLEVDLAEEEVAAEAEEETTATSVVSQVTWRETVPKAVEDTEAAVVATAGAATAETEEEVATVVEEGMEAVVAAEEAATAVGSRDISPGIAPAVDVESDIGPAMGKAESVVSNTNRLSSSRGVLISLLSAFFAYDGSLSFLSSFSGLLLMVFRIRTYGYLFMLFNGVVFNGGACLG